MPLRPPYAMFSRRAGFTLVELMAVVVIISVMVGLAAPAMMNAFGDARARTLRGEIVDAYNIARARATGSGRAQLVRFDASGADGQGSVIAYEGNNSSCVASTWNTVIGAGCGASGFCREEIYPDVRQMGSDVLQLEVASTSNTSFDTVVGDICYEPTGLTFWRVAANNTTFGPMSSENGAVGGATQVRGGFLLRVRRLDSDGNDISVQRNIAIPVGAAARSVL